MPKNKVKHSFEIHGLDEFARTLKQLPAAIAEAALTEAAEAGGKPILDAAKANAPQELGNLKRSLDMKLAVYPHSKTATAIIGPRSREAGYAHLVEFGSGPRETKDGASRGTMPPQPFLRPAIDQTREQSIKAVGRVLGKAIEREAERLAKSGGGK
ncbi:MAG: HK97-gp10 family putative phage morphogenesis protein [Planctomycetota bacterium]